MAIEIAPHVVADPRVRFGKTVIQGTRAAVHVLVAKAAGSVAPEQVADEYGVKVEDVRAALAHAAKLLEQQEVRDFA